jgi:hypothetical protein|tara:strand:- start:608 stop:1105 length:498 start_codon:yes stop_codon:yes gene_type:complete
MAYTHSKQEIVMAGITPSPSGGALSGPTANQHVNSFIGGVTGVVAEWGPGVMPHLIRGLAYVQTAVAVNTAAPVFRFQHVKGVASTATNIGTLVLPTTVTSLGRSCYYLVSGNVEVKPGEAVRVNATAAVTAGVAGRFVLYVEPRWETPGNVTEMILTTGLPSDA